MGYDMYWAEVPEDEAAEVAAYRVGFDTAVAIRDAAPNRTRGDDDPLQAAVHAAYEAMMAAEHSYFRLNIWGMGEAREWLEKVGAAHDRGQHPPFPPYDDSWTDDEFNAAAAPVLAAGVEFPGIPLWKLSDNSGWHVTPIECRSAVAEAAKHEDALADAPTYVVDFLRWIGEAAAHGGFKVH